MGLILTEVLEMSDDEQPGFEVSCTYVYQRNRRPYKTGQQCTRPLHKDGLCKAHFSNRNTSLGKRKKETPVKASAPTKAPGAPRKRLPPQDDSSIDEESDSGDYEQKAKILRRVYAEGLSDSEEEPSSSSSSSSSFIHRLSGSNAARAIFDQDDDFVSEMARIYQDKIHPQTVLMRQLRDENRALKQCLMSMDQHLSKVDQLWKN